MKALLILLSLLVASLEANAQNWIRTPGPVEDNVHDLCIDSNGILYAMTTLGLNRSTDNGDHWTRPFIFPISTDLHRIVITTNNNIIVSALDGIYVSTDSGNSFTKQFEITVWDRMHFCIGAAGRIFAASRFVNLVSDDYGYTWTPTSRVGIVGEQVTVYAIAATHDTAYLQFNSQNGFYRSVDNGNSWFFMRAPMQYGYEQTFMVHPNGSLMRITANSDNVSHLYRYENDSWSPFGFLKHEYRAFACDMMTDGSLLLSAPRGIFHIRDLSSCSDVTHGFETVDSGRSFMRITRFIEDPKNKIYYAATLGAGVWKSAATLLTVNTKTSASSFQVTPNPAQDRVTIEYTAPEPKPVTIKLHDILGRMLWKRTETAVAGQNFVSFDAQSLLPGSYLIVLEMSGEVKTQWVTIL